MPGNPRGDSGNYITQIDNDYVLIAGNTPNVYPTSLNDPVKYSQKNFAVNEVAGVETHTTPMPGFTPLDNSGDFHGGNYTVVAMNGIHLDAGGGGATITSNGNVTLTAAGGIVAITSTAEAKVQAQVVRLQSTHTVMISGPKLYVDTPETVFTNNVKIGGNVIINGGLAVGGELACPHMTGTKSIQTTGEENEQIKGYPILYSSFVCTFEVNPLPEEIGTNMAMITELGGMMPGNLYRLRVMPDPHWLTEGPQPITDTPRHKHFYETIGSSGTAPTDMYSNMKKMESAEPVKPENTGILGQLDPQKALDKAKDDFTKKIKDWGKKLIGL